MNGFNFQENDETKLTDKNIYVLFTIIFVVKTVYYIS